MKRMPNKLYEIVKEKYKPYIKHRFNRRHALEFKNKKIVHEVMEFMLHDELYIKCKSGFEYRPGNYILFNGES